MSITINGRDEPPCIMLDDEHLELNFDMGSKCDSPNKKLDRLTAFLGFSLDAEGCTCTASLGGRNAASEWIQTEKVYCDEGQTIEPSEFGDFIGDVTVPKQTILDLAFSKKEEIDMETLRTEVLAHFHENLEKFNIVASCRWNSRGLNMRVTMAQYGVNKLRFDFQIPYESATVVLQDKRRKTA